MLSAQNKNELNQTLPTQLPRISIIIPTYNNAHFLPETLESVFEQNYDSYEIIIIDDGSTDNTEAVLAPYADKVCYLKQVNAGSAVARNTGLDQARGEYVIFLDADDTLLPGKLKEQTAFLDVRPSIGAVHSGWYIVNEEGERLREITPWQWAPELNLDTWLRYKPVRMGSMMFRRLWIESIGRFDPQFRQAQDFDLLLRLVLQGCKMEWMYRPTLNYRVYPDSTIRKNALDQYRFAMGVLDKFFTHPRVPPSIKDQEAVIRYHSLVWLGWHLYTCNNEDDMIRPLQEAFSCSPWPAINTIFEILKVYLYWLQSEQMKMADLQRIWPHIGQAAALDEETWSLVDRFFCWWADCNPSLEKWEFNDFNLLWSYFQTAVVNEHQQPVSPETHMNWWAYVWWDYVHGRVEKAKTGLMAQFAGITLPELIAQIQLSLIAGCEVINIDQIDRFWALAKQLGIVPENQQRQVVSLYLTYFGQSALRREWSEAKKGLWETIGFGVAPEALRAWSDFSKNAVRYYSSSG